MSDATRPQSDLVYFTHTINGRSYGGWFRLLPAECVEVLSIGLMQTLALSGRRAEDVACRVLEEFVRARERQGHPVPSLPPSLEPREPHHHCERSLLPSH